MLSIGGQSLLPLETNPGVTPEELFRKMCEEYGINEAVGAKLVEEGLASLEDFRRDPWRRVVTVHTYVGWAAGASSSMTLKSKRGWPLFPG